MESSEDKLKLEENDYNPKFSHIVQNDIWNILEASEKNYIFDEIQQKKLLEIYELKENGILEKNGINKDRISNYIKNLWLEIPKNIIFLNNDNLEEFKKIIPTLNQKAFDWKSYNALYNQKLDLPFIFIDSLNLSNFQEPNIILESKAIHEIIHYNTWNHYNLVTKKDNTNTMYNIRFWFQSYSPKSGISMGDIFEEGFVRRHEALYKKESYSKNVNQKKKEIIDKLMPDSSPYNDMHFGYFNIEKERNTINVNDKQFSGVVMDMLINENPELEDLIIWYRKWIKSNYKKIIKVISKYKLKNGKNLYPVLRSLKYWHEEFKKGYFLTKEAITLYNAKNTAEPPTP